MCEERLPVLCIAGPTASGKSDLGVLVAKHVGGEVLSADSMQVYKKMDIGTAKLSREEMDGVPHHLIDLVLPDDPFTVANWVTLAREVIAKLHSEGKLPIVVGGTGLYMRALTDDLDFAQQRGSSEHREYWKNYAVHKGNEALHAELVSRDPQAAARLHPNDVRRVIRALEVYELGNKPLSESYDWRPKQGRYATTQLALTMDRQVLYDRVEQRVDRMLELGLYDEVAGLLQEGYARDLTSMQAIGYKELAGCVAGEVSYAQAVLEIKQATKRFAKRQLSWFRRDERVSWWSRPPAGEWPRETLDAILGIASTLAAGIRLRGLE